MLGKRILQGVWGALVLLCCLTLLTAASPKDYTNVATPVADAAMAAEVDVVRSLLRDGADVNAAQGDGMTALHWAARRGDDALAEMLLYAGANPKAMTRLGGYTPLILAARAGHASVVSRLLSAGVDPDAATDAGTTPLMVAAASGNLEAVGALVEHGANVNSTESMVKRSALMYASANNHAEIIDFLIAEGADVMSATEVRDLNELEKADREERRRRGQNPFGGPIRQEEGEEGQKAEKGKAGNRRAAAKPSVAEGSNSRRASEDSPGGADSKASTKVPFQEPTQAATPPEPKREAEEKTGKGRNVFAKMFSWLPGVGGEKDEKQARRRRRRIPYGELVGKHGGLTPLHFAARQGHLDAAKSLVRAGADVDRLSEGDHTSPLMIATINGHFDLGSYLLDQGADPSLTSDAGATPLYAAINLQWAPKALYPQPQAYRQQRLTYLEFMQRLLDEGADPNVRLEKKLWYSGYNFDLSGVDEAGATPFWRAAYGNDVEAMRLLVSYGGDPGISTMNTQADPTDGIGPRDRKDVSGLPPVPKGGPAVAPLAAASGVGYGEGFAANSHRFAPSGFMPAIEYLVEELGADVNTRDHQGYAPLHHCAARGDNECIEFLVAHGADVTVISREGQTTADMANGPVQRVQPFPETVALLMKLGSENSNKCVSC